MAHATPARGVLFDLDGTLLDTLEDLCDATNETLASRGFPTHPLASYRQFVGQGLRMLVTLAAPESDRRPETLDLLDLELGRRLREEPVRKTRPYPGIPELLSELQARHIPMGICTNKPDPAAQVVADRLLKSWYFVDIHGQRDHVPRKPDPASALAVAARMRLPAEALLFVGDSDVDMQTARAAGMIPIGVAWGFRGREELIAAGAVRILEEPAELLELV